MIVSEELLNKEIRQLEQEMLNLIKLNQIRKRQGLMLGGQPAVNEYIKYIKEVER